MARRNSRSTQPVRNRNANRKKGGGSSGKALWIVLAVVVLAGLGFLAYKLTSGGDYTFDRSHLDKYVESLPDNPALGDDMSVYVDMSDGMNSAYASSESKVLLQNVINKLAANKGIKFFGLADRQIFPLDKSHTELYNYMLDPASYDKQKAPIEDTLKEIVEKNQPALLMTDFEEYKGGVIEHAAYAKKYFIEWLEKGYTIYFYKWDFIEKGKEKKMFLAVFDDNAGRMNSMIETALDIQSNNYVDRFVLAGKGFYFPTYENYLSVKQGGNYHNKDGKDIITNVMEGGGPHDYVCYARTTADATKSEGVAYAPVTNRTGELAEYYPLGVTWKDAIKNAATYKQAGVPEENKYKHLLSKIFIDFGAQSGYTIDEIEVRTFDMQETMKATAAQMEKKKVDADALDKVEKPEINMVLTAQALPVAELPGYVEIAVDFDPRFDGTFVGGYAPTDLIRANIFIASANPNLGEAADFFGWEGNPSLADSVKEALTAPSSNPTGKILFSYYLKTIAE
ncbi:MAG: hypothetical protein K2N05_11070 [Muribaculaceae bacterium]|nr:hypothetical protein [Muribaculaceae bacterium]